MTSWQPRLAGRSGPRYRAIADALADAVSEGSLHPGDRLPTHRELASRLGVTVPTVSRAYREAGRRGLISGQVGRGTYVAGAEAPSAEPAGQDQGEIDLDLNQLPSPPELVSGFQAVLSALAADPKSARLLRYQPNAGAPAFREAGARWLERCGLEAPVERVLLTSGSQHGLLLVLAAVARPGETVLAESLAWPGVRRAAELLGLSLARVPLDGEGVVPEAFAEACARLKPKALFCSPTAQNPTTATMSAARREAVAAIAERHEVAIIEDDIYGPLIDARPPPLTRLLPGRAFYLASLSKAFAAGLRIGYVLAPTPFVGRIAAGLGATTITATPLMAEIARRWIHDGTADRLLQAQRREIGRRIEVALARLGPERCRVVRHAAHVWYRLPPPWRPAGLIAACQRRGLRITPTEAFAEDSAGAPDCLRLSLGGPPGADRLDEALSRLLQVIAAGPDEPLGTV
jgi:DNA-binding transcriptional MocR family regulator